MKIKGNKTVFTFCAIIVIAIIVVVSIILSKQLKSTRYHSEDKSENITVPLVTKLLSMGEKGMLKLTEHLGSENEASLVEKYWSDINQELKNESTIKIVFDIEEDLYDFTVEECTPLHVAVKLGYIEATRLFLDRGANTFDNVASLNYGGVIENHPCLMFKSAGTPLRIAVQEGHKEIIKLLIDRGADPNFLTWDGQINGVKEPVLFWAKKDDVRQLLIKLRAKTRKELESE